MFGQFGADGGKQAQPRQELALALGARAQRNLRRAGIGGLRQDIARGQRRRHVLGVVDGEAADLEAAPTENGSSRRTVWSSIASAKEKILNTEPSS
jgi:hypothetical protein